MSNEVIHLNVEADWSKVEAIFKKPIIYYSFEKGFRETETLIRSLIVEYRDDLLSDPEVEAAKEFIPIDEDLILSEFKKALKGQIFAEAITEVFTELKLNVEKNILELTEPMNMIQLFSNVMESAFTILINDALFNDESQFTQQMLS